MTALLWARAPRSPTLRPQPGDPRCLVPRLVANLVIALSYVLIALTILRPLRRTGQLRSNALATATAAIFVTCAVTGSRGGLPGAAVVRVGDAPGEAMRDAWSWPLASWDLVGALVALYYWSLRRSYSSLIEGAALFADLGAARAAGARPQRQRPAGPRGGADVARAR